MTVMPVLKVTRASTENNQSASSNGTPATACGLKTEAIRGQLERLLSSPRLASSPRCQSLLRHIVEESLCGHAEELKERTLGVYLFRREADYDTYSDPVVRMAISELRKKLAQYYYEPQHQGQLRIEIPIGSYVPEFSLPEPAPGGDNASRMAGGPDTAASEAHKETEQNRAVRPKPARRGKLLWMGGVAALLLAVCAAVPIWRATAANDPVKQFWAPVASTSNPVLLCLGESRTARIELNPKVWHDASGAPIPLSAGAPPQLKGQASPQLIAMAAVDDMITMTDIAALLRSYNKRSAIQGESTVGYEDLLKGPVVLLGAFTNEWTIQLAKSMRFRFDLNTDSLEAWIADRKKPGERLGLVKLNDSDSMNSPEDYALVARILDSDTKQPLVIVAGITPSGTTTAGKFVTDSQYLGDFIKTLPPGWEKKNLEVVLNAKVIDGQPGPPRVMESVLW